MVRPLDSVHGDEMWNLIHETWMGQPSLKSFSLLLLLICSKPFLIIELCYLSIIISANKALNLKLKRSFGHFIIIPLEDPGLFCVEFACSSCVCVGFLWAFPASPPPPKTCSRGETVTLNWGECEWEWLFVSLCLALQWTDDLSRVCPASHLKSAGIGSTPCNPTQIKRLPKMNKWILDRNDWENKYEFLNIFFWDGA